MYSKQLIQEALAEDLQDRGDVTSRAVFKDEQGTFFLHAKSAGIICGLEMFSSVFQEVDPSIKVRPFFTDGNRIETGDIAAEIHGAVCSILTAERTALNFLSYMSGIATRTAAYVEQAEQSAARNGGKRTHILDTRKTLPGYRRLAKYAVSCGGGRNHRFGLHDMVLIKDNHIDAAGSITEAVSRVRKCWGNRFAIEVETRTLDEVREAAACGADRIMLDNMSCSQMQAAAAEIGGTAETEASGNMALERIAEVSDAGVDFISVGELTHSVKAFDFSLSKTEADLKQAIKRLKKELGPTVIIPAHHYQRREIVELADIVGDSYKLAVEVSNTDTDYIVFCGVRFMAEGAAVLADNHQKVIMPNPSSVCPMAEMITVPQAEKAFKLAAEQAQQEIVPVVYMNAHADLKAFCGRHGGAVCTSSNARQVLEAYISRGKSVFFLPDQHLGINTALSMGMKHDHMHRISADFSIRSYAELGIPGHSEDADFAEKTSPKSGHAPRPQQDYMKQAELFVWDGFCPVHQQFNLQQIDDLRKNHPGITIIVHPEVDSATAAAADRTGSTQQILDIIKQAPAGTVWGVGTEYNFVSRLAAEFADQQKQILPLKPAVCRNMEKTTLENLYETLREIASGTENVSKEKIVTVSPDTAADAEKATTRMIEIVQKLRREQNAGGV